MNTPNIKAVLSHLIQLTSERDSGTLELVMAQTLFNLAAPDAVVIYRVIDAEKGLFSISQMTGESEWKSIPEQLQKELESCINQKSSRQVQCSGHTPMLLYPLLDAKNKVLAVVVIESPESKPQIYELTTMLLEIYKNFVALMNDNERDTLTGLLNRKTFDLKINKVLAQHASAALSTNGETGEVIII